MKALMAEHDCSCGESYDNAEDLAFHRNEECEEGAEAPTEAPKDVVAELPADLVAAFAKTGLFDSSAIDRLAATGPEITNWSLLKFQDALGAQLGFIAHAATQTFVAAQAITVQKKRVLPDAPPYLDDPGDYDATNPAQFYRHIDGSLWRWDGKRGDQEASPGGPDQEGAGLKEGRITYPWGERHPVMVVNHTDVNGVLMPRQGKPSDEGTAQEAIAMGADFFHHGYGCWVGPGGKRDGVVDVETARAVRAARETMESGASDIGFAASALVAG